MGCFSVWLRCDPSCRMTSLLGKECECLLQAEDAASPVAVEERWIFVGVVPRYAVCYGRSGLNEF